MFLFSLCCYCKLFLFYETNETMTYFTMSDFIWTNGLEMILSLHHFFFLFMDKAVEKLESLSIDELKKILRSQNKSDKRVTDKDLLIQMILCEDDDEDSNVINLPQSYLDLFAV